MKTWKVIKIRKLCFIVWSIRQTLSHIAIAWSFKLVVTIRNTRYRFVREKIATVELVNHIRVIFRKIDVLLNLKRWLLLNAVYRAIGEHTWNERRIFNYYVKLSYSLNVISGCAASDRVSPVALQCECIEASCRDKTIEKQIKQISL